MSSRLPGAPTPKLTEAQPGVQVGPFQHDGTGIQWAKGRKPIKVAQVISEQAGVDRDRPSRNDAAKVRCQERLQVQRGEAASQVDVQGGRRLGHGFPQDPQGVEESDGQAASSRLLHEMPAAVLQF